MRIRQAFAVGLLGLAPALTGCLTHTRSVPRIYPAPLVYDSTLDQLLKQVDDRYAAVQSVRYDVTVMASTGGGKQGKVKEYPSLDGWFFLRKPDDLCVILKLPIVRSTALNMVSGSKGWKLYIPIENKAMEGTSQVPDPSQHGLESLRPVVILDSLLVRGVRPGEIVAQTSGSRIIESAVTGKKRLIEEPDYHLAILAQPQGQSARTLRVIHISRANLLPYQQDIYDDQGKIVTETTYGNYKQFGDTQFPTRIVIARPIDQYTLTITVTNILQNQKFDDDQFDLKIPERVPVRNMDHPNESARTNPS